MEWFNMTSKFPDGKLILNLPVYYFAEFIKFQLVTPFKFGYIWTFYFKIIISTVLLYPSMLYRGVTRFN